MGPARIEASRRALPALLVAGLFVVLAARLFRLIALYSVNLFFSDQWDFNVATLFERHSLWEMFRWQHGPHRQGLAALLALLLEPRFGWNSRMESFFVGGLVVVAVLCALWLKVRLFGPVTLWDACIPLILLTPLQYGQIFVVANWAHGPLPLLLLVVFGLAWTAPRAGVRYPLVLLINFGAIYTGFGLFLGMVTPVLLIADWWSRGRHDPRAAAWCAVSLLVALASIASFFVGYVPASAVSCQPDALQEPGKYVHFVALMFGNLVTGPGRIGVSAAIGMMLAAAIVLALAANMVRLRRAQKSLPAIATSALMLYTLLFSLIAAYGRTCLGIGEAQVSRYVMYIELGLFGLYLFALSLDRAAAKLALLGGLAAASASGAIVRAPQRFEMAYYRDLRERWKQCYLESEDVDRCDRLAGHWIHGDPEGRELKPKLDYLKQHKLNLYLDASGPSRP